jgi:sec-independent protein translocase protein TatA
MLEGILQPTHLLVILGAALLLFGPKKLPELGKGLGDGIRNFRDSMKQATAETKTESPDKKHSA